MTSARTGRIAGLSLIAWFAMVGVMAVMAGVKWNQPGFRDQDITSPIEMGMTFGVVMAIPFGAVAFALLFPIAIAADRILRGRLTRGMNLAVGASFAVPTTVGFLVSFWLLFGRHQGFLRFVQSFRDMPDTLIEFLVIFAVGGLIVSLGLRARD